MFCLLPAKNAGGDVSLYEIKSKCCLIVFVLVGKYLCVCQMFCREVNLNYWKVVFTFVPSVDSVEVG